MQSRLALVLLSTFLAAPVAISSQAPPVQPAAVSSKQLILRFFEFRGTREERATQTQTPDYIQHNPRFLRMDEFTGARGNQAWVQAFEEAQRRGNLQLVALGGIPLRNPIILIGEGDLAFAVYRGSITDPAAAGRTYEAFAFESFRIRDGKLSEHWDQVRLEPGWMIPRPPAAGNRGRGAGAGAGQAVPPPAPEPPDGCSASPAAIAANKQVAMSFSGELSARAALRAPDFVEHSPRPNARPTDPQPRVVDHVVAECDYVAVVWKQVLPDPDNASRTWEAFTFDAVRIRGGRVAEHWDHYQR
jgi:predicted SnoaL-like aldol condensation-catalyzing enzyme